MKQVHTIRVTVIKDEYNEAEPWGPPTRSEVVNEISEQVIGKDFDLGWVIEDVS